MKTGKRRKAALEKVDRDRRYTLQEATQLVKDCAFAKFDETVDVAVHLGINPKHADQAVRGAVVLPHGTGSTKRVLVFAKGDKVAEAEAAGADYVGADDFVAKINEGWMEFDTVIATPDMMGQVGRLGRVLGPRGLMPNPKVGTVTFDVQKAVTEAKAGKVEFRAIKEQKQKKASGAVVHVPVGKCSFDPTKLEENVKALLDTLHRLKPAAAKGTYMKSITLSSTMGPGVRIDTSSVAGAEA